jgi:ATP-dependent exoDNAse (exonuclease V) beta subunit
MTPIADQKQRDAALDLSRSCIVQAPAGSGKTSLLVSRYLKILSSGIRPEEIVAITFTKKAAAEMRGRVMKELPAELAPGLRIQTIDALCASLTARMPVLSRFGAQPEVTEDATLLYREAAARALAEATPQVERLLAHLDNFVPNATDLLADMLARRDQWLRATGAAPTRKELELGLRLERGRLLKKARELHPQASPAMAVEMLKKDGKWKAKAPESLKSIGGLEEMLAALLILPPENYSATQWEALEAILGLLNPAVAQLWIVFAENGVVDFTQVAHGALAALGTPDAPTDLALSLDAAVKHLLVDEFQDTSNSQWELLQRLTAGWQPDDGRTVFVVGDPMQSIYRFRDAQVGLFLHARREGLPSMKLESITLATNFRSQGAIVDWVNRVFPRVLPAAEDETSGAVPYVPSVAKHAPEADGAPKLELFARREDEAARVIELVKQARGRTAILVRNRSHLDEIVPALKDAGLRFRAVEIEQLGERQVVQDLFALTRALTHLADRVAWLAILRAPWVGLSLEDFSVHFENKNSQTVWDLIQDIPALARFRAVLAPALANRMRGTLRDRVEGVWLALGGPACVADATDIEDAAIFLDELERLEEAGELADFGALARSLKKLYALPDVEAGPEAVEIMTVHKAKGLEFDTVIVPGLDRPPQASRRPLFAWRALPGSQLLLAPIDETGGVKEPLYEYVRLLDREAEDIEAGRLFYVAATRAISRLHLLGCIKFDKEGQAKLPLKRSILQLAWEALGGSIELPEPVPEESDKDERLPAGELRCLPSDFQMPPVPPAVAWVPPEARREAEPPPFDWAREAVRHAGIVVHAWLQRIAEDRLRGWDAKRVESLRPRITVDLRRRGVAPADLDRAVGIVLTALSNTLSDERGRWLLGPHPVARNEHRLRSPGRSLRVDRYIEASDGIKWVVDYKTSHHEGGDLERFLDQEQERYKVQLNEYGAALGATRCGLYFPVHAQWRSWQLANEPTGDGG